MLLLFIDPRGLEARSSLLSKVLEFMACMASMCLSTSGLASSSSIESSSGAVVALREVEEGCFSCCRCLLLGELSLLSGDDLLLLADLVHHAVSVRLHGYYAPTSCYWVSSLLLFSPPPQWLSGVADSACRLPCAGSGDHDTAGWQLAGCGVMRKASFL